MSGGGVSLFYATRLGQNDWTWPLHARPATPPHALVCYHVCSRDTYAIEGGLAGLEGRVIPSALAVGTSDARHACVTCRLSQVRRLRLDLREGG